VETRFISHQESNMKFSESEFVANARVVKLVAIVAGLFVVNAVKVGACSIYYRLRCRSPNAAELSAQAQLAQADKRTRCPVIPIKRDIDTFQSSRQCPRRLIVPYQVTISV
jgi:hypothetical protein